MNKSETILTALVKAALKSETYNPKEELTTETILDIYKESIAQTVVSLAFEALPENARKDVPQFETAAFGSLTNNIRVTSEHIAIGKVLEDSGIPYCILKGYASAYYYPNPESRTMGDVDFLVAPSDVERATKALENIGYLPAEDADIHDFHIEFFKGQNIAEMHYSISRTTEFGFDPSTITNDILASARFCQTEFGKMKIPDPYHHAIINLLHIYRHYVGTGIGLRHLCDWAVFAASKDYDDITDKFLEFTDKWHLTHFCQMLSQISVRYLGIENKDGFGRFDEKLCCEFMDDIMHLGNFGRKSVNYQGLINLFDAKTPDKKDENYISSFFSSIKSVVCTHWPKAEHNTIILIVGTVVFSAKYLIRSIMGKRQKLHLIDDYKQAKKQVKLRSKLIDNKHSKRDHKE